MRFLQAINSDLSVLIVCNKTGGTIQGDIKKITFGFLLTLEHNHEPFSLLIFMVTKALVINW
jgi:hypothetical protein